MQDISTKTKYFIEVYMDSGYLQVVAEEEEKDEILHPRNQAEVKGDTYGGI